MRSLRLAAATTLGVCLLIAPAVAAPTPTVSISAATTTPEDDVPVVISGRVATVPAGTQAELQRNVGDDWSRVRTVAIGADGTFSTTYRPVVGQNLVRLSLPKTKKTAKATSSAVKLMVLPAMSPSAPVTNQVVTVTGHLPTPLARTARLQIAGPGGWSVVSTGRSSSAGVFALSTRLAGSAQLRVDAPKEKVKDKSVAAFTTPARTVTVTPAPLTSTPPPTVSGSARVGSDLTAQVSGWDAGVGFTYQWLRDDAEIDGATAASRRVVADDLGHRLAVVATGEKAGYISQDRTSDPTPEVQRGTLTAADPSITGRLEVGATLTATSDGWGPGAVDFSYQWQRDGADISDATAQTYQLTDADADARMSVEVTGAQDGYVSETRTSDASAPVAVPTCGTAPPPKSDGTPWKCVFADEFGGSALDRTKWMAQQTAVSGIKSGPGCMVDDDDNISVGSGTLHLTARREAAPFTCHSPNGDTTTEYTNGSVTSFGRFSQAFGRYEFRAKFPDVSVPGLHGALWLYPIIQRYGAWPRSGEIDVAEVYSRYPDRAIPYVHYRTADPDEPTVTNTACKLDPAQFHTYVLEWTTKTLTISYDGTVCVQHTIAPAKPMPAPQPFGQPFAVILTQAQGASGTNQFDPATTPLPATMQVDYVRVWK